ncbi:MAG: thiamine phosphate synthase [Candidatus Saccharicenans sp.]|uniref:thiamine phosphate synthase n=1 Tax=Candidatus Saccharicenans sp. TaxID=2819258 RepID=UPI004049613D
MKFSRLPDLTLYLVTDRRLAGNRSLAEVVQKAVAGGVTIVQLREKECSSREYLELALTLKKLLPPGIPLIINDRLDVALAAAADGLHLGQSDLPPEVARRHLGPGAIIGLTVERPEQLGPAENSPVDYLAISPVFATPTKTDTGPAWCLKGLALARKQTRLPLVAIGGINETNVAEVIRAGADGVAVVSAICVAPDPELAARKLRQLIEEARKGNV